MPVAALFTVCVRVGEVDGQVVRIATVGGADGVCAGQ